MQGNEAKAFLQRQRFHCFTQQAKLRLEMEMERLRQTHSKEIESKDDEVEEIRQSCSKKVGRFLYLIISHKSKCCVREMQICRWI